MLPHALRPPRRLWIMLGGAVALALLVYMAGQLAICAARRLAAGKAYRCGMQHVRSLGLTMQAGSLGTLRTLQRRLSGGRGSGTIPDAGAGSESNASSDACPRPPAANGSASNGQQVVLSAAAEEALRRHLEQIELLLAGRQAALPV